MLKISLWHWKGILTKNIAPILNDVEPPTLASTGPAYDSIQEVHEQHAARGVTVKPHYQRTGH